MKFTLITTLWCHSLIMTQYWHISQRQTPPKIKKIRLFTDTEPVESHCPVCLVCIGEFFYFYQPLYHRRRCFICVCVCVSSRLNDVLEKLTAAGTTAKVDSSTFAFCLRTDLVNIRAQLSLHLTGV